MGEIDDEFPHQALAFDYIENILSICHSRDYDETAKELDALLDKIQAICVDAMDAALTQDLAKVYWDRQQQLITLLKLMMETQHYVLEWDGDHGRQMADLVERAEKLVETL